MATDDSMDDDVFVSEDDVNGRLRVSAKNQSRSGNTPSPTGYRNYQPPAEVLKLCQNDVIESVEPKIHKVRPRPPPGHARN